MRRTEKEQVERLVGKILLSGAVSPDTVITTAEVARQMGLSHQRVDQLKAYVRDNHPQTPLLSVSGIGGGLYISGMATDVQAWEASRKAENATRAKRTDDNTRVFWAEEAKRHGLVPVVEKVDAA